MTNCNTDILLTSNSHSRQKQYHIESVAAFQAYKQLYTEEVMPLLARQKVVEVALTEAEPRAALDAEVMHSLAALSNCTSKCASALSIQLHQRPLQVLMLMQTANPLWIIALLCTACLYWYCCLCSLACTYPANVCQSLARDLPNSLLTAKQVCPAPSPITNCTQACEGALLPC